MASSVLMAPPLTCRLWILFLSQFKYSKFRNGLTSKSVIKLSRTSKWVTNSNKWNFAISLGEKVNLFIRKSIFLICLILFNTSWGSFSIRFPAIIKLSIRREDSSDWRSMCGTVVNRLKARTRTRSLGIRHISSGRYVNRLLWRCKIWRLK